MNTPNQSEKLIKKSTTSLSPWVFQIGLSFLFEAKEEDPEIDLNKCLTIIFYNTQKEKQKEEKVQLNTDLSFTVSIPYIKTCYYNYRIGTQIEQGIRKYTYTKNVQQQVDEWEKLILKIIFKIPSIPEELLLSFSVQFGENEQQYFVSKIELKKREQYYESVQQISLRTKFIILKFSNLSMNDQPDSFAELTIDIEKLQNQSNYLVFCPDLYDLNSIFNQLQNKGNPKIRIIEQNIPLPQCTFKIGASFRFVAEEEDPQSDLKNSLTIIFYDTMNLILKKEQVKLLDNLSFTITIPTYETFYYNYQIGTLIEQGLRRFTYNDEVDQLVDEWNKQTLTIIFQIPPDQILLCLSLQYGEDEKPCFMKKIELKQRGQQYESYEQIQLRTKQLIFNFSKMSIDDSPDSVADLKISMGKLINESNSLIFCPNDDDLINIFKYLAQKTKTKLVNNFYQCQIYKIDLNDEIQKEVNLIQATEYQPIQISKQKKAEITHVVQSQYVQGNMTDKFQIDSLAQTAHIAIQNSQTIIQQALNQQHEIKEQIISDSKGNLIRLQNFIADKKVQSKTEQLSKLINDVNSITKQFLEKIDKKDTFHYYDEKLKGLNKKNQDLTETLQFFQSKTKDMQSTIKLLVEENKKLQAQEQIQEFIKEIQHCYKILQENIEKLKESNEKIKKLEQDIVILENDQTKLREQMQALQIQNLEQAEKILILEQTNQNQTEIIQNDKQRIVQLIQKNKLFKGFYKKLQQQRLNVELSQVFSQNGISVRTAQTIDKQHRQSQSRLPPITNQFSTENIQKQSKCWNP